MALEISEYLLVFLCVGILATQVIVPILLGRPTFPIFKKKNKTVDQALAEAKEDVDLVKKKKQLEVLRTEIEAAEIEQHERKKHGET